MATHSGILDWKIPWTEEPIGLHRGHKKSGMTEHTYTHAQSSQISNTFTHVMTTWIKR